MVQVPKINMAVEIQGVPNVQDAISAMYDTVGGRKGDTIMRSLLRKSSKPYEEALARVIKSKKLIKTSLMLRVGLKIRTPKRQQKGRPWVLTGFSGYYGFHAVFLENGTEERYTEAGLYRGAIKNPKHMRSVAIAYRISRKRVEERFMDLFTKHMETAMKRHHVRVTK